MHEAATLGPHRAPDGCQGLHWVPALGKCAVGLGRPGEEQMFKRYTVGGAWFGMEVSLPAVHVVEGKVY